MDLEVTLSTMLGYIYIEAVVTVLVCQQPTLLPMSLVSLHCNLSDTVVTK